MFSLIIRFLKPEILHKAHPNVKTLEFVLGDNESGVVSAHAKAVKYINLYFGTIDEPVQWINLVPATPNNQKEWDAIPTGYFCTESPVKWELTVWKKTKSNGILFHAYIVEEIFKITILQVHSCPDLCKSVKFNGLPLNDSCAIERQFHFDEEKYAVSDSE